MANRDLQPHHHRRWCLHQNRDDTAAFVDVNNVHATASFLMTVATIAETFMERLLCTADLGATARYISASTLLTTPKDTFTTLADSNEATVQC